MHLHEGRVKEGCGGSVFQIPKKIFSIAGEKLSEDTKTQPNTLLEKYPTLKIPIGLRRK
jgi:hypothetical protein